MQPWIDKASSNTGKNSLHLDHTLSQLQSSSLLPQFNKNETGGFRTLRKGKEKEAFEYHELPEPFGSSQQFTSIDTAFNAFQEVDPLDGSEVLSFLNSATAYNDYVHGDDLRPGSISFISHRHQMDAQHALSEKEKLQHHWTAGFLSAEDIVDYLQSTNYTEDIYGIPIIGQWIKDATTTTDEKQKVVAIERLNMIRHHLIQKANGDPNVAAKDAIEMTDNDWSSSFS